MSFNPIRNSVLLKYWRNPAKLITFTVEEWELFFRQARACKLAAQWAYKIAQLEEFDHLPDPIQQAFEAAWTNAEHHQRAILWEARQVARFLDPLGCKKVLLKGAAYMAMDLEFAQGRLISDLDILVPKDKINEAEEILLKNGWATGKYKPYDQRYYREWMHELPPLLNLKRGMTLDMHHNILPETSRRHINIDPLLTAAVPIVDLDDSPLESLGNIDPLDPTVSPTLAHLDSDSCSWYAFQDVDLVIHAAVHMFQEGEIAGDSLRDIVDIDGLIRFYSQASDDFQTRLLDRAVELKLDRPIYYAIHFAHEILDTPLNPEAAAKLRRLAPGPFTRSAMDALVVKSLTPPQIGFPGYDTSFARFLLYIRSHYGRMPLNLLIPHLWHKTFPKDDLPIPDNDGQELQQEL